MTERYIVAQHRNTITGQWMTGNKVHLDKFRIVETVKPWKRSEAVLVFLSGMLMSSVISYLIIKFI